MNAPHGNEVVAAAPGNEAPAAAAAAPMHRPFGARMALAATGRTAKTMAAKPLVSYITVFSLNFLCV